MEKEGVRPYFVYAALIIAEEKLELLKEKFPEEQQITALQTKIADGLGIKEEPVKEETSETIQNTEPADQIQ